MPTAGFESGIQADPRRWTRYLHEIAEQMVAQGWHPQARKFWEVQKRRATRLFYAATKEQTP